MIKHTWEMWGDIVEQWLTREHGAFSGIPVRMAEALNAQARKRRHFECVPDYLYWRVMSYSAPVLHKMQWHAFKDGDKVPFHKIEAVDVDVLDPLTPDGRPYYDHRRYL